MHTNSHSLCVCVCVCARVCVFVFSLQELKEMNNFAALFAINAAFQCSQVFRLKSTLKVWIP